MRVYKKKLKKSLISLRRGSNQANKDLEDNYGSFFTNEDPTQSHQDKLATSDDPSLGRVDGEETPPTWLCCQVNWTEKVLKRSLHIDLAYLKDYKRWSRSLTASLQWIQH